MVTLQDIANQLGITKGTVSKALNGANDISAELQKTVIETALSLGYTKFLNQKDKKKLCILIKNMEYIKPYEFGYDLILGFKQHAQPAGYQVDVIEITKEIQETESYDVYMMKNFYHGAFVIGFSLQDTWLSSFKNTRVPTVLFDNYIYGNPYVTSISIDNIEALNLAVRHLKSLGHTQIGYLSADLGSYIMQIRFKAFYEAMATYGLPANKRSAFSELTTTDCIQKHLPKLLKAKKTAIICSHDILAHAVIEKCKSLDLYVPRNISIIGFDDIPICAHTSPPMTTIRQDRIQLGKSGYNALASLLAGVHISTLLLHGELIIRDSTGEL